jgi:hypothetical protein
MPARTGLCHGSGASAPRPLPRPCIVGLARMRQQEAGHELGFTRTGMHPPRPGRCRPDCRADGSTNPSHGSNAPPRVAPAGSLSRRAGAAFALPPSLRAAHPRQGRCLRLCGRQRSPRGTAARAGTGLSFACPNATMRSNAPTAKAAMHDSNLRALERAAPTYAHPCVRPEQRSAHGTRDLGARPSCRFFGRAWRRHASRSASPPRQPAASNLQCLVK